VNVESNLANIYKFKGYLAMKKFIGMTILIFFSQSVYAEDDPFTDEASVFSSATIQPGHTSYIPNAAFPVTTLMFGSV